MGRVKRAGKGGGVLGKRGSSRPADIRVIVCYFPLHFVWELKAGGEVYSWSKIVGRWKHYGAGTWAVC